MRQLTLEVRPEVPVSLESFVVGANAEAIAALRCQITAQDGSWLYLWGEPGTGRSHLLRAAAIGASASRSTRYLEAENGAKLTMEAGQLTALDDVDRLDDAGQAALFRALIQARNARGSLILAGNAPPQHLRLREDVRTRIGQALIFELHPLDDAGKTVLLTQQATARGMLLEPEIVEYLLRHGRRDVRWLMSVLDALDEASLTLARPITLPLLRDILQQDSEPELPL